MSKQAESRSPVASKRSGETTNQQQTKATTYTKKCTRQADDASSLAAIARCVPSTRFAKLATDALTLASDAHRLADAIAIELESEGQ